MFFELPVSGGLCVSQLVKKIRSWHYSLFCRLKYWVFSCSESMGSSGRIFNYSSLKDRHILVPHR